MDRERVVLAEVLRARGIAGEVVARSLTDVPDRFASLGTVNARLKSGEDHPLSLERAWPHKGNWVLKFAGIDTMTAAETLRGADLWVPLEERGALQEGEYFQADLIGCQVVDAATGGPVGIVAGWQEFGGPPLMEVETKTGEALIPFVRPLCQVDLVQRTIRMELPEGILDL